MPESTLETPPPAHTVSASSKSVKTDWVAIARELAAEWKTTVVERERRRERPVREAQQLRDSGLVNLLIPAEFGGAGESVLTVSRVIRELCKGDANLGALLGYHFINGGIPRLLDPVGRAEALERKSAAQRWLWGNVTASQVKDFSARRISGGGFIVNGTKPFCTGPSIGDVTTALAAITDSEEVLFAHVPTNRPGLHFLDDWDHLGMRLTDTVSLRFENVEVRADEVLVSSIGPVTRFPPFYGHIAELVFSNYAIGSAAGAFEIAREYTRTKVRPRPGALAESPTQDPYILADYGEFWGKLLALEALSDRAATKVDAALRRRFTITPEERGEAGLETDALRALSISYGLEITSRIFDVTGGARALAANLGHDRFWRDIRSHSVHGGTPGGRWRKIGNYALNGVFEPPGGAGAKKAPPGESHSSAVR